MRARTDALIAADMASLLAYDPETGALTWRERPTHRFREEYQARRWNTRYAGTPALAVKHHAGYFVGSVLGVQVLAHRVCWAVHFGTWPVAAGLDHVNGNGFDNRIENLREAGQGSNLQNMKARSSGSSRYPGVSFFSQTEKWKAGICKDYRQRHLGYFATEEEAFAAYCAAKAKLHTFNPVPREVQHGLV